MHWPRPPGPGLCLRRDELCCHSLYCNRSFICCLWQKGRLGGWRILLALLLLIKFDLIGSPHKPWTSHTSDPYALARTRFCLYSMFYSLWHGQCQAGVSVCCNFIWCPVPAASPSHLSFCWGHDQSCHTVRLFSQLVSPHVYFFLIKCNDRQLLCSFHPCFRSYIRRAWFLSLRCNVCCVLGWWFWRAGPLITRRHSATFTSWQAMRTVTRLIRADTAPSPSHRSGIVNSELSGNELSSLSQYAACLSKGLKTKWAKASDHALIIPWMDLQAGPCCASSCFCHCLM